MSRKATDAEEDVSATAGGGSTQTGPADAAARLGLKAGMVIQELGWDNDTDEQLRVSIEDALDADMVDGDYGNVTRSCCGGVSTTATWSTDSWTP
jgi:hypothetical protein